MAIGSVVQTVRSNLKTQLEARSGLMVCQFLNMLH